MTSINVNVARSLLETLVPDASYEADTKRSPLIAIGTPGAVDQVRELLVELDVPVQDH